jgi:hypothetical protein
MSIGIFTRLLMIVAVSSWENLHFRSFGYDWYDNFKSYFWNTLIHWVSYLISSNCFFLIDQRLIRDNGGIIFLNHLMKIILYFETNFILNIDKNSMKRGSIRSLYDTTITCFLNRYFNWTISYAQKIKIILSFHILFIVASTVLDFF